MSETMDKLQALLKSKETLEAELAAERAKQARAEQDKINAEREAKAAIEQANLDASKFSNTNIFVDKILAAVGKQGLKNPAAPFVVTYLMLTARDAIGQQNPQAGINAIASYFRHANTLKKDG